MDRRNKHGSKIAVVLSAILIFSVMCFGSVEVWSITIVEVSVLTVFTLWLIFRSAAGGVDPIGPRSGQSEKYIFIALSVLVAYIFIQTLPLPSAIVSHISPKAYELYSFYAVNKAQFMPVSLYAYKSGMELTKVLTYAAFFLLVSLTVKDMVTLNRLLKILSYFGFALAVFAIIQHATWTGKIYWFRELTLGGTPFGPFVNRNHYAGLMGMLIPLSLGVAFTRSNRERRILFGFFGLIMAVSLFLSLSRGGIISFFVGIGVFALFLSWKKIRAKKIWFLASFIFMLFLYLVYLGIDPVIDRFYETDITSEERFTVWADTIEAIRDFSLTGSGLGTFIHIFPLYYSESMDSIYDHAHNDYLEFILEAGITGSVLLLVFFVLLFRSALRGIYKEHSGILTISMFSAMASMAVHSMFDFNLHITSNALMFSAISGMAFANSRIHYETVMQETEAKDEDGNY